MGFHVSFRECSQDALKPLLKRVLAAYIERGLGGFWACRVFGRFTAFGVGWGGVQGLWQFMGFGALGFAWGFRVYRVWRFRVYRAWVLRVLEETWG